MAVLQVTPTRMELSRLKKRLAASMRGHKLLKDKRDDLMKRFLYLARTNMELRTRMEEAIGEVYRSFGAAGAGMGEAALREALLFPAGRIEGKAAPKNVMGVKIPEFSFSGTEPGEDGQGDGPYPYGFAFTSAALDASMDALRELLPLMLRLAQAEKTVQLLAEEIEKTRRRVNALEYVQIPTLQETIKSITMKLDENERGNLARLMKIKDQMIAQQRGAQKQHETGFCNRRNEL